MAGELATAYFPVIPLAGYLCYAEFKGTATEYAGLRVYWYDNAKAALAMPSTYAERTEVSDGSRNFLRGWVTAPATAKFARLVPFRYSGTHDMFFFDVDLVEQNPSFFAKMSGNQAIAVQGATTVHFDTDSDFIWGDSLDPFDFTSDFATGSYSFHPRSDGPYELRALVRVLATDDSQVPSYIDIYDTTTAAVIAYGETVGAAHLGTANFGVNLCNAWIVKSFGGAATALVVRYHAFGACTVLAAGSWFAGRQLI